MKQVWLVGILGLFAVTGCGGGGGGGSAGPGNGTASISAFLGTWQGPWNDNNGHSGHLRAIVDANGGLALSLNDDTNNETGSGDGRITNAGKLTADYDWVTSGPLKATGTVTKLPDGRLSGTLTSKSGSTTVSQADLTLTKTSN